jgi:hypothetical protein
MKSHYHASSAPEAIRIGGNCGTPSRISAASSRSFRSLAAWGIVAACACPVVADESLLRPQPTWQIPSVDDARQRVSAWLESQNLADPLRQEAARAWQSLPQQTTHDSLLERMAITVKLVQPAWWEWFRQIAQENPSVQPLELALPDGASSDDFAWNHLSLYAARHLAQQQRYDGAFALIKDLAPEQVIDPATLLFYRAVCQHRLVELEDCRSTLERLRENESELPRRYRYLAQLMVRDTAGVEADSLDDISRRMEDIGRRLELGQADSDVRRREDAVIDAIDKLIKKAEDASKAASASAQSAAGSQPLAPAQESRIAEGKGAGKVDPKDIGNRVDWGNLPEKDREEAMQQIGRQFPAHYREIVEQYFKKLATEADTSTGR